MELTENSKLRSIYEKEHSYMSGEASGMLTDEMRTYDWNSFANGALPRAEPFARNALKRICYYHYSSRSRYYVEMSDLASCHELQHPSPIERASYQSIPHRPSDISYMAYPSDHIESDGCDMSSMAQCFADSLLASSAVASGKWSRRRCACGDIGVVIMSANSGSNQRYQIV